ncbi:hypothetical protein HXX76_011934 [Chlamydomonas incerta]|uniref:Uncharacterized protein n=1 Tax=Chlamydomonas incerta TaxID=51695 RepID=A0A835VST5_CHLIN|nr:hypothetical protein HXX76_011934 [Chlamydomonas incerta]|eukprot:KAG2427947.1 hypothetical protein HXX76_011934 [Chlamydomonas incerta]
MSGTVCGGSGQDFGVDGSSLHLRPDGSVRGSIQVTPQGWGDCFGGSWHSPVLRGRWSPGGQLSILVLDQLELPVPVTFTGKCDSSGLYSGSWAATVPAQGSALPAKGGSAALAKSWSGTQSTDRLPAYLRGLGGPRWAPGAVPAVGSIIRSISASAAHAAAGGTPLPQRPVSGTFNQVYIFPDEKRGGGSSSGSSNGSGAAGTALGSRMATQAPATRPGAGLALSAWGASAAEECTSRAAAGTALHGKQWDSAVEATTVLVHAVALRSPPLTRLSSSLEPSSPGQLPAAVSSAFTSGSRGSNAANGSGGGAAQPLLRPGPVWLRGSALAVTGDLQALRLEVELLPGGGMCGRLGRAAVPGPRHIAAAMPKLGPALTGGAWTADGRVHFTHGHGLAALVFEGICTEDGEWLGEWSAARLAELPSAAVAAANEGTFRMAADALAAD